jgi:Post-segregation antitoxin CcdA/Clp amino terminal domain, pathogenicity island component
MPPKINVYLPDDLAAEVKAAGIPVSAVCQQALADAVAASQGVDPLGGDPFTRRAAGVVSAARDAATGEATTVDLVASLVESGGLALSVLEGADIDPEDLLDELRARQARDGGAGSLDDVVERSIEQARGLGHSYVGTEHLLLGVTAGPPRELANRTLKDMGLRHEGALLGVAAALSAYTFARESLTFSGLSAPIRAALEDIRSRLARLESGLSPRG